MHQLVHALEDRLAVRLRPVVAVGSVGGAVLLARDRARLGVEPLVAAVALDHVAQHVRGGAAGDVFVDERHAARLLDRCHDDAAAIEGQQRLHVDDLRVDAGVRELLRGFDDDAQRGAVRHQRHVPSLAHDLGDAEGHGEVADVRGKFFLDAVAVEHLDHDGRIVAAQ